MSQGYGSQMHKLIGRIGFTVIVACGARNAQMGSKKWNEVECKRCLAKKDKE